MLTLFWDGRDAAQAGELMTVKGEVARRSDLNQVSLDRTTGSRASPDFFLPK